MAAVRRVARSPTARRAAVILALTAVIMAIGWGATSLARSARERSALASPARSVRPGPPFVRPAGSSSLPPGRFVLGPMVGHTTDRSVRIWAKVERPGVLQATLTSSGGVLRSGRAAASPEDSIAIVEVTGLAPATRYVARFELDGQLLAAAPPVELSTFPSPAQPARLRLALVSCANVSYDSRQSVWAAIAADRPDVLLFLGDNNYFQASARRGADGRPAPADWEDPRRMALRNAELRGLLRLQPLLRRAAVYAIWDDHDYGPNDSDRTFPLREASARVFERWWANAYYGGSGLDGIWSHARVGDVELFLLDDRFWRDPDVAPAGPGKTLLGARQKEWLKERLAASTARVKLVALGGQVLADYHPYESYALYAHERAELLDWIRRRRVDGVVFLSGDRHFSELMRRASPGGYPLYELTSSPVANGTFTPGLEQPNPLRLGGHAATPSYGLVDVDTAESGRIVFRIKDDRGREVLAHEVALAELAFARTR